MPKNKDLKRLIRARMEKTGESYTAARIHILSDQLPLPADYERVAGMSDEAVLKATGRTWPQWAEALDEVDAASWEHPEIARYLSESYEGVNSWWAQSVTVAYERFRGLREIGQRRGGDYEIGKSKTFAVPVSRLYAAFTDAALVAAWLPDFDWEITTANPDKSVRAKVADGTRVEAYFTAKGDAKSSVQVQHRKLADPETADATKAFWGERLGALAKVLTNG